MKKLALAMAVGVTFVNAASAYTLPTTATVPVPEPSGFAQLAVGLVVLGGLAFAMRRRVRTNEAN